MSFVAKFNSWCPACNTKILVGDECESAGRRVVHEGCTESRARDPFDCPRDGDDREPEPVVTGRRNHERLCGDCNTIHAGGCW